MNYGRAIRIGRAARGMNQAELAERAGIGHAYLSMLESGKRNNPTLEILEQLARALEIPYPCFWLLASSRVEREEMYGRDMSQLRDADVLYGALLKCLLDEPPSGPA